MPNRRADTIPYSLARLIGIWSGRLTAAPRTLEKGTDVDRIQSRAEIDVRIPPVEFRQRVGAAEALVEIKERRHAVMGQHRPDTQEKSEKSR